MEGSFLIDKKVLIKALIRKVPLMILVTALSAGGAIWYVKHHIKDRWQTTTILMKHQKNPPRGGEIPHLYKTPNFRTILATVKLKKNLQQIIKELKLTETPSQLSGKILVKQGRRSSMIHISVIDYTPRRAVTIANKTAQVFIENFAKIQRNFAKQLKQNYLQREQKLLNIITTLQKEISDDLKREQVISLEGELTQSLKQLGELQLMLIENSMVISDLEIKITSIKKQIRSLPREEILRSTVRDTGKKQLKQLNQQLSDALERYTEENPKVIKLREQIKLLTPKKNRRKTRREPDEITYGKNPLHQSLMLEHLRYRSRLKTTQKRQKSYQREVQQLRDKIARIQRIKERHQQRERRLQLNQKQLEHIEKQISEIELATRPGGSDFEIIEQATRPNHPLNARRKLIVIGGGIAGFLLIFLLLLTREVLDSSLRSPLDFHSLGEERFLGSLYDKDQVPPTRFYSQLQLLFEPLLHPLEKGATIIALGSDRNRTGKSFLIDELVTLLRHHDTRILSIETIYQADPALTPHLINNDIEQGIKSEFKGVTKGYDRGYFLINPETITHFLKRDQWSNWIEKIAPEYHYIFLELPPIDPCKHLVATLLEQIDTVVVVTRFRHSGHNTLEQFTPLIKTDQKSHLKFLLNRVKKEYFQH